MNNPVIAYLPDLAFVNQQFARGMAVLCDRSGNIVETVNADRLVDLDCEVVRLVNRALLPGLVNAHSHAFQRVIRGRTETLSSQSADNFWTWREEMYSAAMRLKPEDIYDASRMAFLEMALTGITSVGEFHYIHRDPHGSAYGDPNLLAKEVIRAARDVGIRIALLRVAYVRAGFNLPANPQQVRFIEPTADEFIRNTERLREDLAKDGDSHAWVGVAPHSIRAVPSDHLAEVGEFANCEGLPIHIHVAEQPAEIAACRDEYGMTPIELFDECGVVSDQFTAVHAIHISEAEIAVLKNAGAFVCACPTTERNLGDGTVPADALFKAGVRVSLGTDSQTMIDLLEDARELEYHLRLRKLERNVLAPESADRSALASRLFDCATINGAASIGAPSGKIEPGSAADFFTIDLDDPSIAGANEDDLLAASVFSLARTAIRDVVVGGKLIVSGSQHASQSEVVSRFAELQKNLWGAN